MREEDSASHRKQYLQKVLGIIGGLVLAFLFAGNAYAQETKTIKVWLGT